MSRKLTTSLRRKAGGAYRRLCRRFLVDSSDDVVLLAGSGRGGTTWFQEMINARRDYRVIFEPFIPNKGSFQHEFVRPYIRADEVDTEFTRQADLILDGHVRSQWTDPYVKRFVYRKRLIKEIRGNLFLHWVAAQRPTTKIVLLLRHPCAVGSGQRRHGWENDALSDVLSQEALVDDHLSEWVTEARAEKDEFRRRLWLWAIENYVPMKALRPDQYRVVFYENLVRAPEQELARVLDYLGDELTDAHLDQVRKPSRTASVAVNNPEEYLHSWRDQVSADEITAAVDILSRFGLDRVYAGSPYPDPSGLEAIRGTPGAPADESKGPPPKTSGV